MPFVELRSFRVYFSPSLRSFRVRVRSLNHLRDNEQKREEKHRNDEIDHLSDGPTKPVGGLRGPSQVQGLLNSPLLLLTDLGEEALDRNEEDAAG